LTEAIWKAVKAVGGKDKKEQKNLLILFLIKFGRFIPHQIFLKLKRFRILLKKC